MGFYEHQILPRVIDWTMGHREVMELRKKYVTGLEGEVLEVGFGSGLNLPFISEKVSRLWALDPATLGRRLAQKRLEKTSVPVEFVDLSEGGKIPLEDNAVDFVLSTFTLCTIPDLTAALQEILRVIKPGGELVFLEHGLSPDQGVQRWQNRLNPMQMCVGGGCHLNRKIDEFIRDAGFEIGELNHFYVKGPKPWTYMYQGRAQKKAAK